MDEWRLCSVVARIWSQFGRAEVDLFASWSNHPCPLWFSLRTQDVFTYSSLLQGLLCPFPPLSAIFPLLLPHGAADTESGSTGTPRSPWSPVLMEILEAWPIPPLRGAVAGSGDDHSTPLDKRSPQGLLRGISKRGEACLTRSSIPS